jgi:hypothetical protein
MAGPRKVLPGDVFAFLTVEGDAAPTPNDRGRGRSPKYRRVTVRCTCGEIAIVRVRDLLRNDVKSCGHLRREHVRNASGRFC